MTRLAGMCELLAADGAIAVAVVPIGPGGRDAARTAGTEAAHAALRHAGCAAPVLAGRAPDGRPLWPEGFTGSIAHRDGIAVAAAARTGTHTALGIDIERAAALPAIDATLVLAPDENDAVSAHADPDALATSLWSAKEAAFKAWSTATAGGLGRVDPVDLRVQLACDGAVVVTATGSLAEATAGIGPLTGRCVTVEDYVVTLVVRPRSGPGEG